MLRASTYAGDLPDVSNLALPKTDRNSTRAFHAVDLNHQNSDSEVRMISRQPLVRTSESKELWQLIDLNSGLESEVPITNLPQQPTTSLLNLWAIHPCYLYWDHPVEVRGTAGHTAIRPRGLKLFGKSSLLQDGVGGVPGFDIVVDGKLNSRDLAFPNLVIASPLPNKIAASFLQKFFQLRS